MKESFVNSKKIFLIQKNRFVYIKENFFESTKLSLIQRNCFFYRILKKCFFDSKKLFLFWMKVKGPLTYIFDENDFFSVVKIIFENV